MSAGTDAYTDQLRVEHREAREALERAGEQLSERETLYEQASRELREAGEDVDYAQQQFMKADADLVGAQESLRRYGIEVAE